MGIFNVRVLEDIENETRESNKKVQELNSNPSRLDYDERIREIRDELNDKMVRIFYQKAM